jgi:RNA polymerase sigma-70 factor, ECF subfamily
MNIEPIVLLSKIKQDDQQAFRQLFSQFYRYLTTIAWRMTNDENTAKDIAQDAFAEFWRKRQELPDDLLVKSYLRQTVVNKCLNYLKTSKRLVFDDMPDDRTTGDSDDAHNQVAFEDMQDILQQTVQELPEKCRIIFSMSRFEEMSHKEIAEKLDITPKTVENQITIALKRIRAALNEGGFLMWGGFIILFSKIIHSAFGG